MILNVFRVQRFRKIHREPHLPVERNRVSDVIIGGKGRDEVREMSVCDGLIMPQHLPEFLSDVRAERRYQNRERLQNLTLMAFHRREVVHRYHE